ncbi:MAG TPA: DNA-3-methyladenine glycosylase [Coriobacteriia bacterium]
MSPRVLGAGFFARDTATVARDLLGCVLVSTAGGYTTSGRIVETEAYLGADDPGSHAATRGITPRNSVMYGPPGRAYIYFTYGNHYMLNVVTKPEGTAGAVLIRALEPLEGLDVMERRRAERRRPGPAPAVRDLVNGPGRLAAALGVGIAVNGEPLDGSATLSVLAREGPVPAVASSGRIGLSSGHEAELRFFIEGDRHVSIARPGQRVPSRSNTKGTVR